MEEKYTWRELLGRIISDPQERQRIADAVNVNPITLTRWATNKSNPRQDNLRPLLEALPHHRQQLAELIALEFPDFFHVDPKPEESLQSIPSAFYTHVLNAYTTSPHQLRTSSVCLLILQQILSHLDPEQQGLLAIIAQCVPPQPGQKVQSLRKTMGRGNDPWGSHMDHQTQFYGAESQAGHALISKHPIILQTREERMRLFPLHILNDEEGYATYPILLADRAAGSLCISTTQRDYFTQMRLDLIQSYTDLLALAFRTNEFFNLHDIELRMMLPRQQQIPYLRGFQSRVTQYMIKASQEGEHLTRPVAETRIWQQLETELFEGEP